MAWRVIKLPCPNTQHFVARVPGRVLDIFHFQAQIMKETQILDATGKGKANMMLGIWMLVDDQGDDEDHQFILVQTGVDLPQVNAELMHVGTTILLLPNGDNLEFTLFHAGLTTEFADMEIPQQESPLPS